MAPQYPAELARLLAAGPGDAQEQAWAGFIAAHSRLLLHTARSLAPDYDAAMDAYARMLDALRADDMRRLRRYVPDGRTRFTTWLVVVARRLCLDEYRRRHGRAPADPSSEARVRRRLVGALGGDIDPDELPSEATTPAAMLEQSDRARAVEESVAALEPRDQLLLKLRIEDGRSAREIAAIMRFPTAFHVYRRLRVVFAALRATLARRGIRGLEG